MSYNWVQFFLYEGYIVWCSIKKKSSVKQINWSIHYVSVHEISIYESENFVCDVLYSKNILQKKKINCHVLLLFCFTLHLFHLFLLHSLVLHYYSLLPTGTFDLVPIEASVIYWTMKLMNVTCNRFNYIYWF